MISIDHLFSFALSTFFLFQGKKLPKSVEEAENDDGEVSDEDEAAELDPDQLSKINPQPAEGEAATEEASGEQVRKIIIMESVGSSDTSIQLCSTLSD